MANKYPSERAMLTRLADLLAKHPSDHAEFTWNRLCDVLQPQSQECLAVVLGDLVRQGSLKRVIRVVSPSTQGGIGDYESLENVPPFLRDWRTDREIEVQPNDLQIIFVTQ